MNNQPESFGTLWKLYMNRTPLAQNHPLVNTPKTASSDLIRQATRQLLRGNNRKSVIRQLASSTARSPAAVAAPPAAALPTTPAAPSPNPTASGSGFGGAGYSGNNAHALGAPSNPGWSMPQPQQPNP